MEKLEVQLPLFSRVLALYDHEYMARVTKLLLCCLMKVLLLVFLGCWQLC